ncbi:MAG: DUF721 domain-containing protein [Parcubacteria group bacterium]|nr:DUF721 domain-containing protein [Parcubacteria group bacterium]
MWQPLSSLIPKAIQKAGIEKSVSDAMVCEEFDRIARRLLGGAAEHCHAVYLKNRTLWVAVLSNAVSNELKLSERDILKALAEEFGADKVVGVRFMM